MEGEKIKVCAYARVSTSSKDQENSLENQITYFTRELEKNPDFEFEGIYPEKGISGTKLQRPEFDKMLIDAGLNIVEIQETNNDNITKVVYVVTLSNRKPKFKYIYVKNTSRFARNIEVMSIINKLVQKGVYIKFLDLEKCTENADDITLIQLFLTLDERESRDKSKKVKFGLEEGKAKGTVFVNGKIYGYKYIKGENKLEKIPEEAKIIEEMFEMYAEGKGARIIAQEFTKKGYKTRDGKDFSFASISKKLRNEKYCGLNNPLRHDTGTVFIDKKSYSKLKDEYETFETDKIEAIISQELFFKCQEVLDGNRDYHNQKKGVFRGHTEMAGKLICMNCLGRHAFRRQTDNNHRRNTSPEKTKAPYVWYRCSNKMKHGASVCSSKNLNPRQIEEEIQRCINGSLLERVEMYRKDLFKVVIFRIEGLLENFNFDLDAEAKKVNDELIEVTNDIKEYYKQKAKNPTSEVLQNLIDENEERKAFLEERSKTVKEDNIRLSEEINEMFSAFKYAIEHLPLLTTFTREDVLNIVNYWYVLNGELVDFRLKACEWLDDIYFDFGNADVIYEPNEDYDVKPVLQKLNDLSVICNTLSS